MLLCLRTGLCELNGQSKSLQFLKVAKSQMFWGLYTVKWNYVKGNDSFFVLKNYDYL